MTSQNTKWLIAAAKKFAALKPDNLFLAAIVASIEAGVVVPSILKTALTAAGFKVVTDHAEHAKHGLRVMANKSRVHVIGPIGVHPDHAMSGGRAASGELIAPTDGTERGLIAAGLADDEADALLHAALGFVRECQHAEDRAAGLPKQNFGVGNLKG